LLRSPSRRGRAFACALLVPAAAWGQVAPSAQLALRWNDPSNIAPISQAELESRLSERLGHPAFDHAATEPALSVTWQGTPEQCQVELRLERGSHIEGTRRIASPSGDCRSLAPALLTVAALLIESRADAQVPSEPEPAAAAPASAPATAPIAAQPAEPSPASRAEPLLLLSAGGELSAGHAPKPELGPALSLVMTPTSRLRLGLRGALFLPQEYGATPGMKLSHVSVGLLGCGMPLTGSLGLGACASVGAQRWASAGVGLAHGQAKSTWASTLGLSARAEWRLTRRLWWVADAGVDVAPTPLYFYYAPPAGGETVVFRQRRLAPSVFLGLTLELP
jgi:hypothetical protein